MKTKFAKSISCILAAVAMVCFGFAISAFTSSRTAYAEATINGWGSSLDNVYVYDTLSVPEDVKIEVDGTLVEPESAVLIFPNGTAMNVVDGYQFTKPGKYVIRYFGTHSGSQISVDKSFVVNTSNYMFSGNVSSATYYEKGKLTSTEAKVSNKLVKINDAGISIVLANGEYFRFNRVFNVYDGSVGNNGLIDVITAFPELDPNTPASVNASHFTVKLVDCYDDSKFIEMYYWTQVSARGEKAIWYGGAGASTQQLTGLHQPYNDGTDVSINGFSGRIRRHDRYAVQNAYGRYNYRDIFAVYSAGGVNFKWNSKTNEVFDGEGFLTDLDHELVYPGNTLPANFFTTGEVYVQLQFQNNNVPSIGVQVTNIMGLKGEQLMETSAKDDAGPEISLDVELTDANGINLVKDYSYTLPKASVIDINASEGYKVAVYYNYGADDIETIALVENGVFKPDKVGMYTAVYTATDLYGNVSEKILNFNVVDGKAFTYNEPSFTKFEGAAVNYVPELTVSSINKNLTVKVIIVAPDGSEKDITDTLNAGNYSFVAEYLGTYKVQYVFADNVYTEIAEYEVVSEDVGKVYFKDQIALPSTFIKDATYDIDSFYGYVATENGLVTQLGELYVKADGAANGTKIANQHKYTVTASDSLAFYAKIGTVATEEIICDVIDVNFNEDKIVQLGDYSGKYKEFYKYFVGADVYNPPKRNDGNYTYGFNGDGEETLSYITPMAFGSFALNFRIPEGQDLFNKLNIIIRDIGPVANSGYVLSYTKTTSGLRYSITSLDGATTYFSAIVDAVMTERHTISINTTTGAVEAGETSVILPSLVGRQIEFAINVPNPTGAFTIQITRVCNQNFNGRLGYSQSETLPEVFFIKPTTTTNVGDKYTLPTFNIGSAFYPLSLSNLKLTMAGEDGRAIKTVDGKTLKNIVANGENPYTFVLEKVDVYIGEFTYNNNGTVMELKTTIVVASSDSVPPTISLNSSTVRIKVGTTHNIKSYSVKDDTTKDSKNLITRVIIFDEYMNFIGWDVKSYKFLEAGNYKVGVYCQDEAGNYALATYDVIVS